MAAPTLTSTRVLHPQALALRELYIGDETATDATTGAFGWGVTPVAAASRVTFTQTYSTALATNPAILTDNSGGSATTTLAAITGGGANCENATKNAIASLAARIVEIQKLQNSMIDALQALGLAL